MRIEFNGPITEENQLNRLKKVDKKTRYSFLFWLIFLWIVLIASELIFSNVLQELWKESVLCSVVLLGVIFLISKTPQNVALRFRLSPHIIITENELSLESWSSGKTTRKLSKVKKVLDCGEVYYIIFKFGDITNSWICQKNNIRSGTIEEFESLFQSKIIKELK